jgi:DeoR/GlpR family transcriptional regulator of sugar metabolism
MDVRLATELLRKQKVSVKDAAALLNVSEDTFRRNHKSLIRQVSARRQAVEVGDVLAIGEQSDTAT